MAKRRRARRERDYFYRRAKELKLRSRAAFKLEQLDRRYGLLRAGDVVLDLGAAPGGWLQIARGRVGERGFVLGVDLQPIAELPYGNVRTIVADVADPTTVEAIKSELPRAADIVLSDLSPKISGIWDVDHARSIELARAGLRIAERVLAPRGKLLMKVFQGGLLDGFVADVKRRFNFVKISKPEASRKGSSEVYIIAKGFERPAGKPNA